jgi:hypothetical protein
MSLMPSALTTLNQASGDTLEQIVAAREQQRLLQQAQMEAAQKQAQQAMEMQLKLRADQRAEATGQRAGAQLTLQQQAAERAADAAAASEREKTNQRGVLNMAREAATRGTLDPMHARFMAVEAGAPMTAFDAPKTEKPFDVTLQETRELSKARAEGTRAGNPPRAGATRVKPTPDAKRFEQTIQGRVGSSGYGSAEEAMKDVTARWQQWRQDYPTLTLSQARAAVANAFGQPVSGGQGDALTAALRRAMTDPALFDDDPN